jgi:hypothetical protein
MAIGSGENGGKGREQMPGRALEELEKALGVQKRR